MKETEIQTTQRRIVLVDRYVKYNTENWPQTSKV